ncbi:hypothetical protein GMOD_00010335 [Pyrenophora seminiperda CCB06]|uniref:Uncharacterized protein n=1 Tax=Pyrenophora seminiperda CCB06 TaxID=1302712 RepID=A0A3M7M5A0_9PLEO|nr:hypothetical protein GMOD_00010335 [Pyrenophora seminiperda CCB06]
MFYLIQYSISNLNAFMLILTIGYSLYCYVDNAKSTESIGKKEDTNEKSHKEEIHEKNDNLSDVNNSPFIYLFKIRGGCRKLLLRVIQSNSGELLKLLVPSHV